MTDLFVTIHGDQWKREDIQEPVEWAKGESWEKTLWSSVKHGDDHDHCQVCWWKLRDSEDPETGEGYISGKHNWLCTECYEQFIKSKP
tara:strand:- start:163 stop:426 length:264 start_codon:yes stop_codon:yes gene_type:complete